MAASRALTRLLRVRGMEEEQQRAELESALAEQRRIEAELHECAARQQRARGLMRAVDDATERLAGRVELETAQRRARVLVVRRTGVERETARLREAFLNKRVERRQAETLIEEAQRRERLALDHRTQQSLDEWHAAKAPAATRPSRPEPAKDEGIVSKDADAIPDAGKRSHF